jgi:hypothetical protein
MRILGVKARQAEAASVDYGSDGLVLGLETPSNRWRVIVWDGVRIAFDPSGNPVA